MSFFLTSTGPGNGADLGGLEGADRYCRMLARAVGGDDERTWRAYLSTTGGGGIDARDRIGDGPWYNSRGVRIADNVANLHSDSNNLTKETQLSEMGLTINGRGDSPNRHDIITGSQMDGTAASAGDDTTCSNWTSHGEGSALVGHHDRQGGGTNPRPGTSRTPPGAAARKTSRARAATASSTASPSTDTVGSSGAGESKSSMKSAA